MSVSAADVFNFVNRAAIVTQLQLIRRDDVLSVDDFAKLSRVWVPGILPDTTLLRPTDLAADSDRPKHDGLGGSSGAWYKPTHKPLENWSKIVMKLIAKHQLFSAMLVRTAM